MENDKLTEILKQADNETLEMACKLLSDPKMVDTVKKLLNDETERRLTENKQKQQLIDREKKVGKYYLIDNGDINAYYHVKSYDDKTKTYTCDNVCYKETNDEKKHFYSTAKQLNFDQKMTSSVFDNVKEIDQETFENYFNKEVGVKRLFDNRSLDLDHFFSDLFF